MKHLDIVRKMISYWQIEKRWIFSHLTSISKILLEWGEIFWPLSTYQPKFFLIVIIYLILIKRHLLNNGHSIKFTIQKSICSSSYTYRQLMKITKFGISFNFPRSIVRHKNIQTCLFHLWRCFKIFDIFNFWLTFSHTSAHVLFVTLFINIILHRHQSLYANGMRLTHFWDKYTDLCQKWIFWAKYTFHISCSCINS